MYLEHFGLGVNPFSLSPKLSFLYKSGTFEESMAHLVYGLDNHEAIVLITGSIGTGKTMALQSFLSNLGPRFEFALVTNTRVKAIELLKLVLEDLGVALPVGADKSDLLILFKDYLAKASHEGKMVLIVVDEAQNLLPEVLEEIRLLTNLGQGEIQPVQIILVGQPELEDAVNRPDLAQIRQRIRVHYTLDPLDHKETGEYINHRMAVAGCGREVFTSGAIEKIYQGSHGVPRLVNTMAGEALLSAFVAGHDMVQPGDVEENQDLRFTTGQAPLPAAAAPPPATPPPVTPSPMAPPSPPAPASQPELMQPPPPPSAPPAPKRRRPRNRHGRTARLWLIAALVVLVLGALYYFGALERLSDAFNRNSWHAAEPAGSGQTAAAIQDPAGERADNAVVVSEPSRATDLENEEIQPTEIEAKLSATGTGDSLIVETKPEPVNQPPADPKPAQGDVPVSAVAKPVTTEPAAATVERADFYIHIYSFRTLERADSYVRRWPGPPDSISTRIKEVRGVDWHRVYVGPYHTLETAYMRALRLEGEGLIGYYKVVQLP